MSERTEVAVRATTTGAVAVLGVLNPPAGVAAAVAKELIDLS